MPAAIRILIRIFLMQRAHIPDCNIFKRKIPQNTLCQKIIYITPEPTENSVLVYLQGFAYNYKLSKNHQK